MRLNRNERMIFVTAIFATNVAMADNGYFQIGQGAEARGLGGAGVAATRDVSGGAMNPATPAWVGERFEAGLSFVTGSTKFTRRSDLNAPLDSVLNTSATTKDATGVIADFAWNKQIQPELNFSLIGYSNGAYSKYGGSTTVCPSEQAPGTTYVGNPLCGNGDLSSSLKQFVLAPTLSRKLSDSVSIGGSILLAAQEFSVEGLQGLASQSTTPKKVSNNGVSYSYGLGFRIGGFWKASNTLSFGASWSPKINMSAFKEYEGLLSNGGRSDIPENYALGLQYTPTDTISILADYQKINYGEALGLSSAAYDGTKKRGTDDGPGNGWQNMDVLKLGVRYQMNKALSLSTGVSFNTKAFENKTTTHNVVTPATFTRHLTLGLGYNTTPKTQWSMYYTKAFGEKTVGKSALASAVATQLTAVPTEIGEETLDTKEQIIGIQFSTSF